MDKMNELNKNSPTDYQLAMKLLNQTVFEIISVK